MYKIPDVISRDGLKAITLKYCAFGDNTIKIVNLLNQDVLHQRIDNPGVNMSASLIENDNIVIYLTFDKSWYIPPIIKIWYLKQNALKEIITGHHPQASELIYCYHDTSNSLVSADPYQGIVCAYNINTLAVMWQNKESDSFDNDSIIALDISSCGKMVSVLQEKQLNIYHLITGKVLLTTTLLNKYSNCYFNHNSRYFEISSAENPSIKINYQSILKE